MCPRSSVPVRLVGGFVILMVVVASLVSASMLSLATDPARPQAQPVPVPTPAAPQSAASVPAVIAQRPAPVPAPAPPGGSAPPRGEVSQATVLVLLGLPVLATALVTLRSWAGLSAVTTVLGPGRVVTACQECG